MNATDFFKCLSDPTRLQSTLLVFSEGQVCVCELVEALEASQPKISRHLGQLRQSGLLADQRRDQWVFYSIHPDLPDWARKVLSETFEAHKNQLQAPLAKLKTMADRPSRCNS